MTDSELRKEAERILKYFDEVPMRKDFKPKYLFAALRAVHDDAIDKVAKIAARHAKECRGIRSFEGEGEALHILRDAIALKLGGGK